jgi:hypothetical protein
MLLMPEHYRTLNLWAGCAARLWLSAVGSQTLTTKDTKVHEAVARFPSWTFVSFVVNDFIFFESAFPNDRTEVLKDQFSTISTGESVATIGKNLLSAVGYRLSGFGRRLSNPSLGREVLRAKSREPRAKNQELELKNFS